MKANSIGALVRSRSGASVASSLFTAVALFATFRAGVSNGSAAVVGCWALFQGIFVVSRIADSGAGSNLTRWTAEARASKRFPGLRPTTAAGLALSTAPVAVLGAILLYPAFWFVSSRYSGEFSPTQFIMLAVFSYIFAIMTSAATILLSVLEGLGLLVLKSYIISASGVVGTVVVWPLTTVDAVTGLGQTYVAMSTVQLVAALTAAAVLRRRYKADVVTVASRIMSGLWRETWHLSGVGLLRLTFEPTSKICLSLVGSLNDIASFELALRVSTQCRVLLQAALQPLLVAGARSGGSLVDEQRQYFARAATLAGHAAILLMVIQIVMAPVLSFLGFGSVVQTFLLFFCLLVVANTINALGLPGYFLQLSSGRIVPLLKIQTWMSVINLTGAGVLGWSVGSTGVVVSYCAAFVFGGVACLIIEAKMLERPVGALFNSMRWLDFVGIGLTIVLGLTGALALHHIDDRWALILAILLCIVYCVAWTYRMLPTLRDAISPKLNRPGGPRGEVT